MKAVKRLGPIVLLLSYLVLGARPWKVLAQADSGFTKVGSTAVGVLTFTDTTAADGVSYQYEVTAALNASLESTALRGNVVTIPATGVHSTTTTWGASPTAGAFYNVYRTTIVAPNPPGAVSTIVN